VRAPCEPGYRMAPPPGADRRMVGQAGEMAALAGVLLGPAERARFHDKLAGPIIQRDQEQIIGDS